MVLIAWDADQVDGFMGMLGSDDLKAKMEEAGVVGAPEYWTGEKG